MSHISSRLRGILTFLIVCIGLAYAFIEGSYTWRGRLDLQFFGLIFFGCGLLAWLVWRGLVQRASLPKTGWGWVFLLGLVAVALSLASSGDPRQSLWRVSWLAGLVLLFYILVDGFDAGWLDRKAALAALLVVSGVVILLALLETYAWYLRWFAAVGYGEWPAFQFRFGSIFGYSNVLMSLANLCAPLALIVFLKGNSRLWRVGAALWLLFYLVVIPFSSSRGGWMGLAGWVGGLVLLWLIDARPWRMVLGWRRLYRGLFLGGLMGGLAAAAVLGLRFWLAFSAHPSHGGDPFGGRGYLWAYALDLWRTSPLFGIGPGRYTLEHPIVNPNVPPLFWSYNAHGMPVQILTEFGLLGALTLVALLAVGGRQLWKCWRAADSNRAPYVMALLAGLIGWLFQMIVDDFTSWIAIMVPLVLMVAWITTAPPQPLARHNRQIVPGKATPPGLRLNLLWIPAAILLAYAAWDLWGYAPAWNGLKAASSGRWSEAAAGMSASASRDPRLVFYDTESGFAESWAWRESGDPAALAQARDWFTRSLTREPQLSMLRANLAVLDWQAGFPVKALDGLREASAQSPIEPSYPLNLGYYLETSGNKIAALAEYRRALDLAPEWRTHPFWQTSPLRAQALLDWVPPQGKELITDTNIVRFEEALRSGDLKSAHRFLARAAVQVDVTPQEARLSEAEGNLPRALALYRSLRDLTDLPILRRVSNFSFAYSLWAYNRPGLWVDRVPGYLNLDGGEDQFAALQHLHTLEVQRGECVEAERTWTVWQRAVRGQSPEKIPTVPKCP